MKSNRRQKKIKKADLTSRVDVYALLMAYFDNYVEQTASMLIAADEDDEFPYESVAKHDAVVAAQLNAVFTGADSQMTIPSPNWNGAALGRHLRARFAMQLLSLSAEDAELFAEDEMVVYFGMIQMVSEMRALALLLFAKMKKTWRCRAERCTSSARNGLKFSQIHLSRCRSRRHPIRKRQFADRAKLQYVGSTMSRLNLFYEENEEETQEAVGLSVFKSWKPR